MMENNPPDITQLHHRELLTEEVQEVISYRPHWLVRYGNTIFLAVLCGLLLLTFFISYPDIIPASAKLTAANPPRLVNAKMQGKLIKLFTSDNATATAGQHLGYMESTADYKQVMQLVQWVDTAVALNATGDIKHIGQMTLPALPGLGELQSSFQQFQNELEITKQTFEGGYYAKKKDALYKDLFYNNRLKGFTQKQKQLHQQDRALQEREYKAYEQLAKDKVISLLELNQYKSKLLGKDQGLEQMDAEVTGADISSHSTYKELIEIEKQVTDQRQRFRSALLQLKSEIEQWMQQYVLTAPQAGKVLFVTTLAENQLIQMGQSLFYIQPQQSGYYAELLAGQHGIGKIKKGQKVLLKVEGYPSEEFGYLAGNINYVSDIPNRADSFLLKASLPQGLTTHYNKQLGFRNELAAQAEIITDDRKLIERFTAQLKKIWIRK